MIMRFLDDDSFACLFGNEQKTIETLTSAGALLQQRSCMCGNDMVRVISESKPVFRCNINQCKKQLSYRIGSLFHESGLRCRKIMRIGRCWLKQESRDEAVKSTLVNPKTITRWIPYST